MVDQPTQKEMSLLEKPWQAGARLISGASRYSSTHCVMAELGWQAINDHYIRSKLRYFNRLQRNISIGLARWMYLRRMADARYVLFDVSLRRVQRKLGVAAVVPHQRRTRQHHDYAVLATPVIDSDASDSDHADTDPNNNGDNSDDNYDPNNDVNTNTSDSVDSEHDLRPRATRTHRLSSSFCVGTLYSCWYAA